MSMNTNPGSASVVRQAPTETQTTNPRTVMNMLEMRMFALEVGDENGIRRRIVAFNVNGDWYHDPGGEDWIKRLKPIGKDGWLGKVLTERFADMTTTPVVPNKDTVDIMGS